MPTAQTTGPVRRKSQPPARRSRDRQTKITKPPAHHAAHDFLRQTFLPLGQFEGFQKTKYRLHEQHFRKALTNLCQHFSIPMPQTLQEPFPYNLLNAFDQVQEQIQKKQTGTRLLITKKDGFTTLATVQEAGISHSLFYVSINTLDWLHQQQNRDTFLLLTSVYAYLHQVAGMPLVCGNDFIESAYNCISEWVLNGEDEYDPCEWRDKLCTLTEMRRKMPILEKCVAGPEQLACFRKRVRQYKPESKAEKELHRVARDLLALYKQFPGKNFYENIYTELIEEAEEERVYPDQYFSFFWDDNDWLYESIMEHVNCDLQERSRFVQPMLCTWFSDLVPQPSTDLAFERRLLQLIEELSSVTYLFKI